MYGEAIAEFQKAIGLDGGSPPSLAALAHAYAVSGKRGQALSLLSRLKELELSKQEYVSAYDLAVIHTGLGDKDQAFKSLERAYEQRDGWMAFIRSPDNISIELLQRGWDHGEKLPPQEPWASMPNTGVW